MDPTLFPTPKRRYLDVHGVEMFWAEEGEGRPLVLLHGLGDSHRTWEPVVRRLSKKYRVLMPDLPGHGLSARPNATYSLAWHARMLANWMEMLGLEEVDLVGHSFGGGVAQWLLIDNSALVRRLALVSAGGLGHDVAVALRLASIPGFIERFGQPLMGLGTRIAMRVLGCPFDEEETAALAWMNSKPGTAAAFARTVKDVINLRGQRRSIWDGAHLVPRLPPILLVWGERDPVIPIRHGASLSSRVDGVSFARFPECGHYPHRECPDAFASAIEVFLADETTRAATLRHAPPKRPERTRLRRLVPDVLRSHRY
ncbi:MAG: alpha/beta fold hydrolase [Polyangiaceae bacterium]